MPLPLFQVVCKVIDRNSYFAHPENVIVSMMADSNKSLRQKAVNAILDNRREASNVEQPIRKFIKPKLNFNALSYDEMVDIRKIEPPLTRKMSDNELKSCIADEDNVVKKAMDGIPNNTLAVERYVQLVSQTSHKVIGENERNRLICTTIASRDFLPNMNSKKDYVEYMNSAKK